jgi:hypothetical protein
MMEGDVEVHNLGGETLFHNLCMFHSIALLTLFYNMPWIHTKTKVPY